MLVLDQSKKSAQSQMLAVNLLYLLVFTLSTSFMVRNQTGIHLFKNECPIHKSNPTGRTDFATKF